MHRLRVKQNVQIFLQNGKIIKILNGYHRIAKLNAFMSGQHGVNAIVNQKLIQDAVIMKFKKKNVPVLTIITSGWNGLNVLTQKNLIDAMLNPLDGDV